MVVSLSNTITSYGDRYPAGCTEERSNRSINRRRLGHGAHGLGLPMMAQRALLLAALASAGQTVGGGTGRTVAGPGRTGGVPGQAGQTDAGRAPGGVSVGPPITAYLALANATRGGCAQWALNASDSTVRLLRGGAALPSCLAYGGYTEANTGLAACVGWTEPGIGAQLWTVAAGGTGGGARLQVKGFAKQLAVVDCGLASALGLITCSPGGGDCGPHAPGCAGGFEWTLRGPNASFELVSRLRVGMCAVVTSAKPPAPSEPKPVGPLPGGGGAWSTVCNSTAACPVEQTCCKLNSSNWGCCPGPNATCCPGGVTCCPGGHACSAHGIDTYTGATVYGCKKALAPAEVAGASSLTQRLTLEGWPPVLSGLTPPAPRAHLAYVAAASTSLSVRSTDGKASVTVEISTGEILAVGSGAHSFATRALSSLLPAVGSTWVVAVTQLDGGGVRVERSLTGTAKVVEQFTADPSAPSAVLWSLSVVGLAEKAFTMPISTSFAFDQATAESDLQFWALWDRGSYSGPDPGPWTDPLKPSDGKRGFWNGTCNYGIVYGDAGSAADMVVAPVVTVLHTATDAGFSLVMNPADAGLAWCVLSISLATITCTRTCTNFVHTLFGFPGEDKSVQVQKESEWHHTCGHAPRRCDEIVKVF